jgi:hypothetical protein
LIARRAEPELSSDTRRRSFNTSSVAEISNMFG